jgi:hypothetical protein
LRYFYGFTAAALGFEHTEFADGTVGELSSAVAIDLGAHIAYLAKVTSNPRVESYCLLGIEPEALFSPLIRSVRHKANAIGAP